MLKKIFLFLAFFLFIKSFAQFAIVTDQDGFVNIREKPNAKSKITGKIKTSEIVYIFDKGDENPNWSIIDFYRTDGNLLTGYVYNSKIKKISSYEQIPSSNTNENGAEFNVRNIKAVIRSEKFDYQSQKKFFSKTNYKGVEIEDRYKGQQIWGTDGSIPKSHYQSITFSVGNQIIKIPAKDFENLFNINIELTKCYFDAKTETLYLTAMNGDGAGSYEVLFIIRKGKYIGRKIYAFS